MLNMCLRRCQNLPNSFDTFKKDICSKFFPFLAEERERKNVSQGELAVAIPINTKMYSHGCLTASTYTEDLRPAILNDKFSTADQERPNTV